MEKIIKKDTIWEYNRKHLIITKSNNSREDKKYMLMSLENDYPISTARIKAVLTMLYIIFIYGIASTIWGFVIHGSIFWVTVGGVIFGFIVGGISALVIAGKRTVMQVNDMQFATSAIWGNIGIIIGVLGLVAWIIRVIFFH